MSSDERRLPSSLNVIQSIVLCQIYERFDGHFAKNTHQISFIQCSVENNADFHSFSDPNGTSDAYQGKFI